MNDLQFFLILNKEANYKNSYCACERMKQAPPQKKKKKKKLETWLSQNHSQNWAGALLHQLIFDRP